MQALKSVNTEPIPGYRLLEPLGKGGFGEVWKCEAPGGLHKAIKFVTNGDDALHQDGSGAEQELRALQHVKAIRHPFLLSMDRVEVVNGELLIVMELADRSLQDLLEQRRKAGHPGIAREELLAYLEEAAEVLDLMNLEHGLQHLDIKPRNLFLVGRHVKVADFGLVNSLAELNGNQPHAVQLGAITPLYAAPESFLGKITVFSDQYSLAVTYHELLTGALPFAGKNFRQLAMQHMQEDPDLSRLPELDRPHVARALAKDATKRFASCMEFITALESVTRMMVAADPLGLGGPLGGLPIKAPTSHDISVGEMANTASVSARTSNRLMGVTLPPESGIAQAHVPAPAGALHGYTFLECVGRGPTGEVWKAQAPDGRKRLVRYVFGYDPAALDDEQGPLVRLQSLQHPVLAPMQIIREETGRLTLLVDAGETTLGTRLKECLTGGLPGVPRIELLGHLRTAAEALDALYQTHRLQHLGLTPRHLMLTDDILTIPDFALVELVWLPAGHQPAALNARYAAPELFDNQISRHCDQYSLALIFQELLTGVHPFRNLNQRQMALARLRGKPDLGMAPASDRPILMRALNNEPDERFRSCTELIEALETIPAAASANVRGKPTAPAAIVTRVGLDNSAPEDTRIGPASPAASPPPPIAPAQVEIPLLSTAAYAKILDEVIQEAETGQELHDYRNIRYLERPGKLIQHHCFARLIPGTAHLKLQGFCEQWEARLTARDNHTFAFLVPSVGNLWQRALGKSAGLEVQIRIDSPKNDGVPMTNVTMEIRPVGIAESKAIPLLRETGPELLDSLRHFLQASAERRNAERWNFEKTIQICPVFEGQRLGDPIVSQGRDISRTGIGVYMPCRPPTMQVRVRLPHGPRGEVASIPGRIAHVAPCADGRYDIGVNFS
jgi:serine/threonine protein kinase